MCGIAGIVSFSSGQPDLAALIKKMSDKIKHRGPDDEGYLFFSQDGTKTFGGDDTSREVYESRFPYSPKQSLKSVEGDYYGVIGHRRLSILDLSPAGHQPMCTQDGDVWITYNGEIYNYIELRNDLEKKNHVFQTGTDTEIILHSYQEYGKDCLEKFNGMWAFVIFDKKENLLFGARDRFGLKPFYYYKDQKYFAFASEQKALITLPFLHTSINPKAAFDYLVLDEYENREEGMFQNIFELMPSHAFSMNLKNNAFNQWRYYDLPYEDKSEEFNENMLLHHKEKVSELLANSVVTHLRSDARLGSCLSGGIDSSSIVCLVDQLQKDQELKQIGEKQEVFTACFENKKYDESHWAKQVVDQTNSNWQKISIDSSTLLDDIEELVYAQDVPFYSTSVYSHFQLMKQFKNNKFKVALDGQGGDEIFAGYDPHVISYWLELFSDRQYSNLIKEINVSEQSLVTPKILRSNLIKKYILKMLPASFITNLYKNKKEYKYISAGFWDDHSKQLKGKQANIQISLNKLLYENITGTRFKSLLKSFDRNSMFHSVELRMPFADDLPLIEYLFQVPSVYKIREKTTKYLLREAVKGIIPEPIRQRKDKVAFDTPESLWLSGIKHELKPYFSSDLNDFLSTSKIHKNWDTLLDVDTNQNTGRLWRLINFAIWKKVYNL